MNQPRNKVIMKTIKIDEAKFSPRVEFNSNGEMIICGRSIMEDPSVFYNPIIESIKNCQSKTFTLEFRLDYMNTSSSKVLLNLMLAIKERFNNNHVFIKWYYDSDDEDILEIGRDFESIICIPIDFYELCEDEGYV